MIAIGQGQNLLSLVDYRLKYMYCFASIERLQCVSTENKI